MIDLNTTDWPIVRMSLKGASQDSDVKKYLKDYDNLLKKKAPYAAVVDLLQAEKMPEAQRALQLEWVKKNTEILEKYCRGTALIVGPLAARLAIKAFLKIRPLPFPTQVFGSVKEGLVWAQKQMTAT